MIFIIFLWILNFGISWWNAYAVGTAWIESKFAGGWTRFLIWCGAVMSASGFTWCFLILFALLGHAVDPRVVTEEVVTLSLKLGYVILVPGIMLSGYAITFDSWARAYRERSAANMGVAAWNTFSSAYNTYHVIRDYGGAFKDVSEAFSEVFDSKGSSRDDEKAKAIILVGLIVIVAIVSGCLLTAAIIRRSAGRAELPQSLRDRLR